MGTAFRKSGTLQALRTLSTIQSELYRSWEDFAKHSAGMKPSDIFRQLSGKLFDVKNWAKYDDEDIYIKQEIIDE